MKIEARIATGRSKCRGEKHQGINRKIPKGTDCYHIVQINTGTGSFVAFYCRDCIIDMFIEFEQELKKNGIYDEAVMKAVLD
jgi:hypothetical protein